MLSMGDRREAAPGAALTYHSVRTDGIERVTTRTAAVLHGVLPSRRRGRVRAGRRRHGAAVRRPVLDGRVHFRRLGAGVSAGGRVGCARRNPFGCALVVDPKREIDGALEALRRTGGAEVRVFEPRSESGGDAGDEGFFVERSHGPLGRSRLCRRVCAGRRLPRPGRCLAQPQLHSDRCPQAVGWTAIGVATGGGAQHPFD